MGGYIGLIVIAGATTGVLVDAVKVSDNARLLALGPRSAGGRPRALRRPGRAPGRGAAGAYWAVCLASIALSALLLWWRYRPGAEE